MKQYLTNTIIKHKNELISSIFYIQKGTIIETKTNKVYTEHSYLFLEYIYSNSYSISDYITKTLVIGYWIEYKDIDISFLSIFSNILNQTLKHNELLKISDPLIKLSRYLYYEYLNKKTPSFYIMSNKDLSLYLNISNIKISEYIQHLINQGIISKHNRLINILKIKSLEDLSFLLDYHN